jgi:hypothetical protein
MEEEPRDLSTALDERLRSLTRIKVRGTPATVTESMPVRIPILRDRQCFFF